MKETKRLIIYLVLVFAITWALEFFVVYPISEKDGYGKNVLANGIVAAMMFVPALCVLLTRLFTKEGFKDSQLTLNLGKGRTRYYLIAWFLPPILCALGALVYFLVLPGEFDTGHSYLIQQNAEMGVTMTPEEIDSRVVMGIVVALLLSPLLNVVTCFGEEWGWRGYMMPKLRKRIKFVPAVLLGGLIWGLWHAPLIALGHNYGNGYAGAPWLGIAMMCLFCIATGTLFTWWSERAGSVWPAVIGHGAVNGFAAAPMYFIADNNHALLGPTTAGLIGGSAFLVAAIAVMIFYRKPKQATLAAG
ncbi:MAG: CPBP family intramembrane metalloprotease [Bacteroidales bacterium]|nr:CPBP family intramembrane metalloprotease [Bacteroidales bacterium]MBQ9528986.1 CPBP family intramembrane metalloprotease [Bacteroidales bacterium]